MKGFKNEFARVNCPDEELYLSESDGYYNLYFKNGYYDKNVYVNAKPEERKANYEKVKDKLPKPYWEGQEGRIKAYDYSWKVAFSHVKYPTKKNGFVSPYIDTSFNMSTFMSDSPAMMWYTKYADHLFDFRGTLSNFYCKQHIDGFICREIRADNGRDRFHRFDPTSSGIIWLAFTEWELYMQNADKERLSKVFDPLMAFHIWLKRYRTNPDGSYWTCGLGSTADNQPRLPKGYSRRIDTGNMAWVDLTIYMLIDAQSLIKMAKVLGREKEVEELKKEKDFLLNYLLDNLWDKKKKFFFDKNADGTLNSCKSIIAFWALHVDDMPKEIIDALVKHLVNKDEFNRFNPVPSISADSDMYVPNGQYWRGGVWSCMNYGVFLGLVKRGYSDVAFDFANRHNLHVSEIYNNPSEEHKKHAKNKNEANTLWECYAPDSNDFSDPSLPEFIGWSALSTIAILFEFVFGIIPVPTEDMIIWNVNITDKFGIKDYPFKGKLINLNCEARKDNKEEPNVTVTGGVKVKVIWNGKEKIING